MGYIAHKLEALHEARELSVARRLAAIETAPFDNAFQKSEEARHLGVMRAAAKFERTLLNITERMHEYATYAKILKTELIVCSVLALSGLGFHALSKIKKADPLQPPAATQNEEIRWPKSDSEFIRDNTVGNPNFRRATGLDR